MTTPFPEIDHASWKARLTKELKNHTWEDIQWRVSEYFSLEPLYDADSVEDIGYLSAFHEKWVELKGVSKPSILSSTVALGDNSDIKTAESYGLKAWVDEFSNAQNAFGLDCYSRLWDKNILEAGPHTEFDPVFDSLAFGKKVSAFSFDALPANTNLHIHAADIHQAGGSAVQELAMALLVAEHYRQQTETLDWAKDSVIHLAAGPQFWLEMCKFRAMRLLWMNFCDANGLKDQNANIRGCSSKVFWSKTDSDINLIRHTIEAMSGILGGADEILIQPHTLSPNSGLDATRQAINIGHLALEESNLGEFTDPAAGSYMADMLTHKLAEAAWKKFAEWNEIGLEKLMETGQLQKEIQTESQKLKSSFEEKKTTMLGVNAFPSEFAVKSIPFPVFQTHASPEFEPFRPVFLDV